MLTAKVTQSNGHVVHVRLVQADSSTDTTVVTGDTAAPLAMAATGEGEATAEAGVASAPNPIAPESKELYWAAGSFIVHPEVQHITICEIEPRIPPATAKYFAKENHGVVTYKRTSVVYDDARHYAFSNVFEVASKSKPWEKVAVAKNFEYVLEVMRAEGTSEWRTAAHDEFAFCR